MTWNYSEYGDNADHVFAAMQKNQGTAAVISFGQDGKQPVAKQYATSEEASTAYDSIVNAPTDRWWVGLYDTVKSATPNGRVDETYFGGVAVTTEKKVKVPAVMGALAALGLLLLMAKAK